MGASRHSRRMTRSGCSFAPSLLSIACGNRWRSRLLFSRMKLKAIVNSCANFTSERLRKPRSVWMFFRTIIAFDRVRQQMEITAVVFTDEAEGDREQLRELYERAVAETEIGLDVLSHHHCFRSRAATDGDHGCCFHG